MIKISDEHKAKIVEILQKGADTSLNSAISKMTPILQHYHQLPPQKLGKRLLNSLFRSWLSKENEAIVHYYNLCQLVTRYHYTIEHLDHEVPCGGLGRTAIIGSTHADIVIYSHPSRRPGTSLIVIECRELGRD